MNEELEPLTPVQRPPLSGAAGTNVDSRFGEILQAELVHSNLPEAHGVPQQFGLSALLALLGVFSAVFGFLRYIGAPAPVYLFLGSMAAVTGLAQMRFGGVPRVASVFSGALFLPVFWIGTGIVFDAMYDGRFSPSYTEMIFGTPCMVIGGGFLGYLIGTVVAGVFLLANMWEERGRAHSKQDDNVHGPFT